MGTFKFDSTVGYVAVTVCLMMMMTMMMMCLLQLVVIDVYNHRFHKVFTMCESVTHITERDDIYV